MTSIQLLIICIAIMWLACLVWFGVMCHTAPRGREIPGVGFVRDLDEDDGCEFVNNGVDNGKQIEKWERRYGHD
jgi:hypothetical protein